MTIRKMTIKDYKEVYNLWLSCEGMGLNNLDDSEEGIDRFLKRNPDTCFVAESNGAIIGAIIAGNDGRRGYIYHTAVNKDFRRQRVAKQLVGEVMTEFEKCGITKVNLVVFKRNSDGNDFWEKEGFTMRDDLVYRNKLIKNIVRIDT